VGEKVDGSMVEMQERGEDKRVLTALTMIQSACETISWTARAASKSLGFPEVRAFRERL